MESSLNDKPQSFIHQPLQSPDKQIRLLRLVNAGPTDADEIFTELSVWTDDEAPEYKAISYTWGEPVSLRSLQINGRSFTARCNCHHALWQTWLHYPGDYIWIDSICINQNNSEEKSVQVQKMASIFTNAKTVLISVGMYDDRSDCLQSYAKELKSIGESAKDFILPAFDQRRYWIAMRGEEYVHDATEVIRAFMTRPYWSRLWIVQEILLATTKAVLCGNNLLEWLYVQLFQYWSGNAAVENGPLNFDTVVYLAAYGPLSFDYAIGAVKSFHCTDVRDRLYGILGLIDSGTKRSMGNLVDYSITPIELLLRVMVNMQQPTRIASVFNAMNMLEFTFVSREMQDLIACARQQNGLASNTATAALDGNNVWIQLELSVRSHCQINENLEGLLIAKFSELPNEISIPIANPYLSFNSSDSNIPDYATRIYKETSLCALVCAEARSGDIIVSSAYAWAENLLVLRHAEGESYSIVGQGLCVNGFYPHRDEQYLNTIVRVRLTAPEALVLYGQDYMGEKIYENKTEGGAMFDHQARLQRLRTPVVFDEVPNVRASLVQDKRPSYERDMPETIAAEDQACVPF